MAIRIERSDMVATIVMDRPEARNAVDGPAARALIEAFAEFERDEALRVADEGQGHELRGDAVERGLAVGVVALAAALDDVRLERPIGHWSLRGERGWGQNFP